MVRRRAIWNATTDNSTAPNIKLPVTAEHISNAERRNSRHCMVADAIVEHFGGKQECQYPVVDVRRGVAFTLASTGLRYRYPVLPWNAAANIAKFDDGKPVKPFQIYLKDGRAELGSWKQTVRRKKYKATDRDKSHKRKAASRQRNPMPPRERMHGVQVY